MRFATVFLLSLLASGCSTTVLRDAPDIAPPTVAAAHIEPAPAAFDAGAVNTWEERETIVTLWSRGAGILRIESVAIEGSASWSMTTELDLPTALATGSRLPVALRYVGDLPGSQDAELVVTSNDPSTPELRVPFTARQLLPQIELVPEIIEVGEVLVGCTRSVPVEIFNVGDGPLDVGDLEFSSSPAGLSLQGAPAGETIEPGGSASFDVTWFAADVNGFATTLLIESSDLERPVLEAPTFAAGRALVTRVDEFVYEQPSALVDVLFVVDNSCSMADEQSSLGGNFSSFVTGLENSGSDYRLAATTTDLADGGGLVGNPAIITPATFEPPETFANNVALGTGGSSVEQGFAPASLALQTLAGSPPPEGFLRPGAPLQIVFVSDEPEQSPGSVSQWVAELRSFRPAPEDTVLSAISGGDLGCSSPAGSAWPGPRYVQAVEMTGGTSSSICSGDWGEDLEMLGLMVAGGSGLLPLSVAPVPASVTVTVNGLGWPSSRWAFNEAANAVVLLQPRPDDGDAIDVQYLVPEGCEG